MTRRLAAAVCTAFCASAGIGNAIDVGGTPLSQSNAVRLRGCASHRPARVPLLERATLDESARRWANGATLTAALQGAGYRERRTAALHVSGGESALTDALRSQLCAAVTDADLSELGSFRRGDDDWVILAAPLVLPALGDGASQATLVLELTNRARARPRRCGNRNFAAAPPLTLEPRLSEAASAHARDMLAQHYFDHRDPAGHSPADRVRARGYRYAIVGENLAAGATDAHEAMQGWLDSPGHCENIMDPRFTQLGVGFADTASGAARIDWVQVFATPAR
jgi:uncharacterized protein YkwD